MKRVLPIALVSIVLVAVAAWHYGSAFDTPRDDDVASSSPGRTRSDAVGAAPESRPELPAPDRTPAAVEPPVPAVANHADLAPLPGAMTIDPATASSHAREAADDSSMPASSVGVPPADADIDPATGAAVMRPTPQVDDVTMSPGKALPGDVEIDPATGAATSR